MSSFNMFHGTDPHTIVDACRQKHESSKIAAVLADCTVVHYMIWKRGWWRQMRLSRHASKDLGCTIQSTGAPYPSCHKDAYRLVVPENLRVTRSGVHNP